MNSALSMRGKKLGVWNYVLTTEIGFGTQFLVGKPGGQLYAVLGASAETVTLPRSGRGGDQWFAYFNQMYGLTERDDYAKFCYDSVRAYAIQHGAPTELRRFAAFDQVEHTAYLSAYNGTMYRLDGGDNVDIVPCGEDGVFFIDDDLGVHVEPDIGAHGLLIDRITSLNFASMGLSGITAEQQRMAITIWLFALGLPDLMPTKPLLILEGAQGSGKTSAVQLLQLALMGASKPLIISKNKEDDFGVLLLRSPIAILDNLDSYIDWIPDAVCAYTTAGFWSKRKLFTDEEETIIRPHAFIAVASKNPSSFRREDVADRCVILRLERRAEFTRFQQLKETIVNERPQLFGEYLYYINQIVREIRHGETVDPPNESHRMADFASLGRIVGRVLGWEASSIEELMLALQAERDAFINEDDPLIDLLAQWVDYKSKFAPPNRGREVTVFQLLAELESIAQAKEQKLKYSTRTLAQKLRSPHIEREFKIETLAVAGHKHYRIWRHSDPRLEIVG